MDFVDWRKKTEEQRIPSEAVQKAARAYQRRRYADYIEEQIREAQERGDFANLPGMGKPLPADGYVRAGDKSMAYNLLKSNGFAPPEIELLKEIDTERRRVETGLQRLIHQRKMLQSRRLSPSERERRAFNQSVEKAAADYEQRLRALNSKILTLNIVAPATLHRPVLDIAHLVQQFREACPPFAV